MTVRIDQIGEIEVARIRHVGPQSGLGACFERLMKWVATIGARPGRSIALEHDNPNLVPPEKRRWDACVELHTDAQPPADIVIDRLPAGRYAVYTHKGPYDGIPNTYSYLFGSWLPDSGETLDERPSMEVYRNTPLDTAPEDLLTDLCIPLKAPASR